jgi:hypothetical protein
LTSTSFGTVVARIYTSRAQIPVPGATVAITQKNENSGHQTLLAVRVSNENGRIAPVQIPTPAVGAGTAPGGVVPFAIVNLWVEASGYETLLVENLQVFPGTQTIQELELIPLPEQTAPPSRTEIVHTPPQNL